MIVCFMLELYESDSFIQRTFHTTKESAENLGKHLTGYEDGHYKIKKGVFIETDW